MRKLGMLLAVMILLGSVGVAAATNLTIKDLGSSVPLGGVYAGPYTGSLDGGTTTFPVVCDDFNTHITIPTTFPVTTETIGSLSGAKFSSQGVFKYEEAAWLMTQMQTNTPSTDGVINYAIWSLFGTGVPDVGQGTWLTAANSAVTANNLDYSDIKIYTAIPPESSQEFMTGSVVPRNGVPTPEPVTMLLLGFGLVGLAGVRRFKK